MKTARLGSFTAAVSVLLGASSALLAAVPNNSRSAAEGILPPAAVLTDEMRSAYQAHASTSCKPEPPLEARLELSGAPALNQPVRLVLSALPMQEMLRPQVEWDLPQTGLRAARTRASVAAGPLRAKSVAQFSMDLVFTQPGRYELSASLLEQGAAGNWGRTARLWVQIGAGKAAVSAQPPSQLIGLLLPAVQVKAGETIRKSAAKSLAPPPVDKPASGPDDRAPAGATRSPNTRLSGHFYYRGHDGVLHPAYGTIAEIWDRDSSTADDLLAKAIVDDSGYFQSPYFDNADGEGGAQELYILWRSYNGRVFVFNPDNGSSYAAILNVGEKPTGDNDVGGWLIDTDGPGTYADDGIEGGYEVCDTLSRGWAHYNYNLGKDISLVNCRWKPGGTDGAYYNGGSDQRITLTDGDHYDTSVILHEYGHKVMDFLKGGFPSGSGGAHSWFGHYTEGLAWSEGWATYSGQSTLNHPVYTDSPGVGDSANFSINLENETGSDPGSTTEASVCAALWDLNDNLYGDPQPHDYIALGPDEIADVFHNGGTENSVLDFRNAWISRGYSQGAIDLIFKDHNILPFEKADTAIAVAAAAGQFDQTVQLVASLRRTTDSFPLASRVLQFQVNGSIAGTVFTDGSGIARVNYTIPAAGGAGSRTISVSFAGDSTYNGSTGTGTLAVTGYPTSLTVANRSGAVGQQVTLNATLRRSSDASAISGRSVTFRVQGSVVGSATTNATGTAALSYKILAPIGVGAKSITAQFSGDSNFAASSGSGTLTVSKANVRVFVANRSGNRGQVIVLNAILRRATDNAFLSGKTVTFRVGSTVVGTAVTNASGVASRSYTIPASAPSGTQSLTASFAGDSLYNAGSGSGTLTVN